LGPVNETGVLSKMYGDDFMVEKVFGSRQWKCALFPF
jgi:hypothetical protein